MQLRNFIHKTLASGILQGRKREGKEKEGEGVRKKSSGGEDKKGRRNGGDALASFMST